MATTRTFDVVKGTFNFVVSEANGYRSREEGVINSGAGILPAGTVLMKSGAGYVGFDGTSPAAGILAEDVDASAAAVKRTVFVRDCEVQRAMLSFVAGADAGEQVAAYASLASAGIAFR